MATHKPFVEGFPIELEANGFTYAAAALRDQFSTLAHALKALDKSEQRTLSNDGVPSRHPEFVDLDDLQHDSHFCPSDTTVRLSQVHAQQPL
ncbi:hypothetical protein ACRQ5Q_41220 (plasmid) [Bradyrhizobium sp. PMVTL-01]|uniref:hypothetical protein n=1 Tax=Bradyrhizobium sp. PMVTL-01 TaxID=3434999 RepID=UPI003F72A47C